SGTTVRPGRAARAAGRHQHGLAVPGRPGRVAAAAGSDPRPGEGAGRAAGGRRGARERRGRVRSQVGVRAGGRRPAMTVDWAKLDAALTAALAEPAAGQLAVFAELAGTPDDAGLALLRRLGVPEARSVVTLTASPADLAELSRQPWVR